MSSIEARGKKKVDHYKLPSMA